MQSKAVSGWEDHIQAGRKYLKTACNGRSRPAVFNNELIFQLGAMAIERFIVGLTQFHHRMPIDHTLSGLVEELRPVCSMPADLAGRIKGVEAVDNMCTLSATHRIPPTESAIQELLAVCRQVESLVDAQLT